MTETNYPLIIIILIWLIWFFIYFWSKNKWIIKNPYKHKELKNIWISIQTKIIQIGSEIHDSWEFGEIEYRYYVLEYTDKKKEKYLYKIFENAIEMNLNISDFFSKKILKNFKIGDSIRCYINPKNYKEYYIDPEDVFTSLK